MTRKFISLAAALGLTLYGCGGKKTNPVVSNSNPLLGSYRLVQDILLPDLRGNPMPAAQQITWSFADTTYQAFARVSKRPFGVPLSIPSYQDTLHYETGRYWINQENDRLHSLTMEMSHGRQFDFEKKSMGNLAPALYNLDVLLGENMIRIGRLSFQRIDYK